MRSDIGSFRRPNVLERVLNRAFGFLVGFGFGLRHNCLLQVRGRKMGRFIPPRLISSSSVASDFLLRHEDEGSGYGMLRRLGKLP